MTRFNLSPQQQRIWLLMEERGTFNTKCCLELDGPFDLGAFTGLVRKLYANHEILRTTYATHEKNRFPHQLVYAEYEADVRYLDLEPLSPEARAGKREEIYREQYRVADFVDGGVSFFVLRMSPQKHCLIIKALELCLDASAMRYLVGQIAGFYAGSAPSAGEAETPLQYAQFSEWQTELLATSGPEKETSYWDDLDPARLGTVAPGTPVRYETTTMRMSAAQVRVLENLAGRYARTLPEFLMACWSLLTYRVSGRKQEVLGVVYDGRGDEVLEGALGVFAKVLPVRYQPDPGAAFEAHLESLAGAYAGAAQWADYYLLGTPDGKIEYAPYCFEFNDYRLATAEGAGTGLRVTDCGSFVDAFVLKLAVACTPGGMQLDLQWDTAAFDQARVEAYKDYFDVLVDEAAKAPAVAVERLLSLDQTGALMQRKSAEEYWLRKLRGVAHHPLYPAGGARSEAAGPGEYLLPLPGELGQSLAAVAGGNEVSTYLLLLTALKILVYKYTQAEDVVIGTIAPAVAVPPGGTGEGLLFSRTPVNDALTPRELLAAGLAELNDVRAYAGFNLGNFLDRYRSNAIGSEEALFAVGFGYAPAGRPAPPETGARLHLGVTGGAGSYTLRIAYARDQYEPYHVRQAAAHFANVLRGVLANSQAPIAQIDVLSPADREQLRDGFNHTAGPAPAHATVVEAFEAQVRRTPGATAVVCGEKTLTYGQLNETANSLAYALRSGYATGADDLVGLVLDRSERMIVALLGVLKAGAAYVPVDPAYPDERKAFILGEAKPKLLLVDGHTRVDERLYAGDQLALDQVLPGWEGVPGNPEAPIAPSDLAYVIYTSGSTGKPKGCQLEHGNLSNYVHWANDYYFGEADPGGNFGLFTSLSFDFTITSIFCPLLRGRCVYVYGQQHDIAAVLRDNFTGSNPIDAIKLTPSHIQVLEQLGVGATRIRKVITGGEELTKNHLAVLQRISPDLVVFNEYGPTEATVGCTVKKVGWDEPVTIGRPIANTRIYILNGKGALSPVGVDGEICVAGRGLARGYHGNAGLTAQRFTPNPLDPRERLYRTGDVGRWLPGGEILFLGRQDNQWKINGYRVEPEEIESVLTQHPAVRQAVVLGNEDAHGQKYLAAYYIAPEPLSADKVRAHLGRFLPEYMLPAHYVQVEAFPLTANGKLDKKALQKQGSRRATPAREAPASPAEAVLAGFWREVLGIDEIGVNDNFFHLGGNSIKGIRLANKIQEWTGQVTHIALLFQAPTIRELAARLSAPAGTPAGGITPAKVAVLRDAIRPPVPAAPAGPKNPPALFILSPPRSGSTLLRIILAGHPQLFAPPELSLLTYNTLAERKAHLSGRLSLYLEGVIRAVMEIKGCDAQAAKAMIARYEDEGVTTQEFYGILQGWLAGRMLIDKTPSYALEPGTLDKAEQYFEAPHYIHLLRNPHANIHSFEEAKLDQLFPYESSFPVGELAELTWLISHQNILAFLERVPPARRHVVRFEDLIREPGEVISGLCRRLGLPYHEGMLKVYQETGGRMTDGIYAESKMIGDFKFLKHTDINPNVITNWQKNKQSRRLADDTLALAAALGYADAGKPVALEKIEPVPAADYYEISHAQKRLWVLSQLEGGAVAYNIPGGLVLEGTPDPQALRRVFDTLVERHEILRTVYVLRDDELKQQVLPPARMPFRLEELDLRGANAEERVRELAEMEGLRPFDTARGPLLRATLIRTGAEKYVLLFTMHHIISDGWTVNVLVREIVTLYRAYKAGRDNPLPPLPIQYKDYAAWQNRRLQGPELQRLQDYWLDQFRGAPPVSQLPIDFPRRAIRTFRGDRVTYTLDAATCAGLKRLSQDHQASLFMTVLSLVKLLLYRYTGQRDLVVGTPIAGREHAELENQIGFYVNTLALRTRIEPDEAFGSLLAAVRKTTLGAYDHQLYPFDRLVERLNLNRDMSRFPLFDVYVVLESNQIERTFDALEDLRVSRFNGVHNVSRFDLLFILREQGNAMDLILEYNTDLFRRERIEKLGNLYLELLQGVLDHPATAVERLPFSGQADRAEYIFQADQGDFDL